MYKPGPPCHGPASPIHQAQPQPQLAFHQLPTHQSHQAHHLALAFKFVIVLAAIHITPQLAHQPHQPQPLQVAAELIPQPQPLQELTDTKAWFIAQALFIYKSFALSGVNIDSQVQVLVQAASGAFGDV